MRIAFAITNLSELLVGELIKQSRHQWIDVYTNNHNAVEPIESLGLECIYMPPVCSGNKMEEDKKFYDKFMPGELDGLEIESFPVWKSLSLDRLKFWCDNGYSGYDIPHYDVCYSSLDIMSVFPWIIKADKRIGVKVDSLRTRTMVDFLGLGYLDEIIVSYDDELSLHKTAVSKGITRQVKPELKNDGFKQSYSVGRKIAGIIFDKQNDWQYRELLSFLSRNVNSEWYFVAFATDERSAQLFPSIGGVIETQPISMLKMCDTVIDFSFHESIYNNTLGEYTILDYGNVNNSIEVSDGLSVKVKYESSDIFR